MSALQSLLAASSASQPLNGHENVSGGTAAFLWLLVGSCAVLLVVGWFRPRR